MASSITFLMLFLAATLPMCCLARICSNYLIPEVTDVKKYNLGSKKIIKRACWDDTAQYAQLLDENKDGTADVYASEDYITRAGNMIFETSIEYQKKVCKEKPSSSYCCKHGVESVDVLETRVCWLILGASTKIQGKLYTAVLNNTEGYDGNGVFKYSSVWGYRCNGDDELRRVALTNDVAYRTKCATPDEVWKSRFFL